MTGCSVLPTAGPVSEQASIQNQRAINARQALLDLEEIDVLIKLDNDWLADVFESTLKSQADASGQYEFRKLKLTFGAQTVSLDAIIDISDQQGNIISASVSGEIRLNFSADRLEWLPIFRQLQISSRDFSFEDISYVEPLPELIQSSLQSLNSNIAETLVEENHHIVPFNTVPLGTVQVGASLPGFSESSAQQTQALTGVIMVAGSAMLIDSSFTTVAVDMAFIPDLSTCPADITVSRAEFVSDVKNREPVGIIRSTNDIADIRYFYSVISGAKRDMAVIHYWFADGLPQSVEELAVGPSKRWRTWSSKGTTHGDARHWEVLVVEKESGCILLSKSIRTLDPDLAMSEVDRAQARQSFMALRDEFDSQSAEFSIAKDKPDIALVELRRPFLSDVLKASMADLNINAEFSSSVLSPLQFSATIQNFDTGDIMCSHSSCPPAPVCKINVSQCKRLRDTRDCSSCEFRNPLNNRCVSKAIDPLCAASRERQNARYDAERTACIADAESLKQECDQLNANAQRSCQIESGFEGPVCESVKTELESLEKESILARANTRTRASGRLSVNFSNFRIEDDLGSLKLDINLASRLRLSGQIDFQPAADSHPLARCIADWNAPFNSRFATTPAVKNLLSRFEENDSSLTANWSGFGLTIDTKPAPLESVFLENPQRLANCNIGLTMNKVEEAFAGEGADFFRGKLDLEIQPLPTVIQLAPASIEFEDHVFSADGILSARHLRYDIKE